MPNFHCQSTNLILAVPCVLGQHTDPGTLPRKPEAVRWDRVNLPHLVKETSSLCLFFSFIHKASEHSPLVSENE